MDDHPPLLVIAGPTAAGKTGLAVELCQALDGEIVSADSRQVYRGLDIGTAKASAEEQAAAPHHLIDVAEPDEIFDAARFVELARGAIAAIRGRGRVPLVVGGTGFYLRALCGGLTPVAGRDDALRAEFETLAEREGRAALHARLAAVDPVSAGRLPVNDLVRVIRALEVHALTGQPLSACQAEHRFSDRPYRDHWVVVDRPAEELELRIARRAAQMFERGLVEEAVALRERHGPVALLDTMGYREALALADGTLDRTQAIEQTRLRTRRYAKRQRTWLRREPVQLWLTEPDPARLLAFARASALDLD